MTLRNLMTSLLALTLMVCVVGCDSDTDETSNLAASDWPACYKAGFCSEAAAQGYFTEAQGNIHAGETMESSGCDDSAGHSSEWIEGSNHYLRGSLCVLDICFDTIECGAN